MVLMSMPRVRARPTGGAPGGVPGPRCALESRPMPRTRTIPKQLRRLPGALAAMLLLLALNAASAAAAFRASSRSIAARAPGSRRSCFGMVRVLGIGRDSRAHRGPGTPPGAPPVGLALTLGMLINTILNRPPQALAAYDGR